MKIEIEEELLNKLTEDSLLLSILNDNGVNEWKGYVDSWNTFEQCKLIIDENNGR